MTKSALAIEYDTGDSTDVLNLVSELTSAYSHDMAASVTRRDELDRYHAKKSAVIYSALLKVLRKPSTRITHADKNLLFFWIRSFVLTTWSEVPQTHQEEHAKNMSMFPLVGHLSIFIFSLDCPDTAEAVHHMRRSLAELENLSM